MMDRHLTGMNDGQANYNKYVCTLQFITLEVGTKNGSEFE